MANEFKIKNGLVVDQGGAIITGSVLVSTNVTAISFTGSLLGSASYALTASYALNGGGGGGTPAGFDTYIQINKAGTFGGYDEFKYIYTSQSFEQGYAVTASGDYSHAEGYNTQATGYASHAEGSDTQAIIESAHAEGKATLAAGKASHAEGTSTQATGNYSHAEGSGTTSNGDVSHAEGTSTTANGKFSHSEGDTTTTIGDYSHAEGQNAYAIGVGSHAEGSGNVSGWKSFAVSTTLGTASFTDPGDFTSYFPAPSTIISDVGMYNYNSSSFDGSITYIYLDDINITPTYLADFNDLANTLAVNSQGNYSHAEGISTRAAGDYSHTEGDSTQAIGYASHAEGISTQAIGYASHAEGISTQAIGYASHAEGQGTQAAGDYSHAEGQNAYAIGEGAHAEGSGTQATGVSSHAEGKSTQAVGQSSHAEGSNTLAIGGGSHTEGDNTLTGGLNGYLATSVSSGVVTLSGSYGDVTADYPANQYLYINDYDYDSSYFTIASLIQSSSFNGTETEIYLVDTSVTTTTAVVGNISIGASSWVGDQTYQGPYSHAEGESTQAIGYASHAEGESTQAIGYASHAEGVSAQAIGSYSHAEGAYTQATGYASHAEGISTYSVGNFSHTEGAGTQATGIASHAEGYSAQAIGNYSHAEGGYTIASGSFQHVSGKYNTHGDDTSLFIIGNGVDDSNRSDIVRITTTDVQVSGSLNVSGSNVDLKIDNIFNVELSGINIISLDPGNGLKLYDISSTESIQVEGRSLVDTIGQFSVDWSNRQLIKSDGTTIAFDWENGTFTGSLQGTSSWAENSLTASYALNGGVTQIVAGTNVTISPVNGLGVVTINSTATGGGSGTNTTSSFSSATTWTFTHGLNSRYVVIQTLDSSHNQIIPQNIELTDANTATITFPSPETGYAIASLGGVGDLAATASYVLNAVSASYVSSAGNSTTLDIYSFSSNVDSYLLMSNVIGTSGVAIGGDSDLRYNSSTNKLTVGTVSATSFTGSLLGSSSWSTNSISSSYALNADTASYVLSSVSSSFASTASYSLNLGATIGQNAAGTIQLKNSAGTVISSINVNTLTSSLAYTASYVAQAVSASYILQAVSASYATTSSFIRPLTQNVIITGSVNISGSITLTSGSVTMPDRPAFRVTGAGGAKVATTALSGSYLNVDFQQGTGWNNSTGTFTAPVAGLYQVNVIVRTNSNSLGTISQLIVYKNNTGGTTGTVQIMIEFGTNTTMNHAGGSTISKLAVGDTLKMVVTSGEISFDQNDNFSVAYIG